MPRGVGVMPFNWNCREGCCPWSSPLALDNLDERSWLVVRMGRQGLSRLGGDGGVVRNDLSLRHRIFQLMGKGVVSNSSKSCTLQTPSSVRIAP